MLGYKLLKYNFITQIILKIKGCVFLLNSQLKIYVENMQLLRCTEIFKHYVEMFLNHEVDVGLVQSYNPYLTCRFSKLFCMQGCQDTSDILSTIHKAFLKKPNSAHRTYF